MPEHVFTTILSFWSGRRESFEFIAEASSTPPSTFSSSNPSRAGTTNLSSFFFAERLSPPHRFGRRGGVPPAQRFVLPAPPDVVSSGKIKARRRRPQPIEVGRPESTFIAGESFEEENLTSSLAGFRPSS